MLTDPDPTTGEVLIVNVTTLRARIQRDESCVFQGGEHGLILHESWVWYHQAKLRTVDYLEACIEVHRRPLSDAHLVMVARGALISQAFTRNFQPLIRKQYPQI